MTSDIPPRCIDTVATRDVAADVTPPVFISENLGIGRDSACYDDNLVSPLSRGYPLVLPPLLYIDLEPHCSDGRINIDAIGTTESYASTE